MVRWCWYSSDGDSNGKVTVMIVSDGDSNGKVYVCMQ